MPLCKGQIMHLHNISANSTSSGKSRQISSASGTKPKIAGTSKAASSPSSNVTKQLAIERPVQRHSTLSPLQHTRSHVVQTITISRGSHRRSLAVRRPLSDPVLRLARVRQRQGQASRGRLRRRRHLRHCFGTDSCRQSPLYHLFLPPSSRLSRASNPPAAKQMPLPGL